MTEVRKIQCPSCGSNSTYKLFDGSYKCNYCQGSFMVNDGQQQRPAPLNRPQATLPVANPKKVIVLVLGIFVTLGIAMSTFYIVGSQTSVGFPESSTSVLHQPPAIKMTRAFAGTASSVVWIITAKDLDADSLCYELSVIEPQTNTMKGKRIIVPAFRSNSSFDLTKKLGNSFWQYGDLAYNLSDDNGLVAYNIYTGETVLNPKLLSEKLPQLKPGILKTEHRSSERLFELTTTNGDVFKFDPFTQSILPAPVSGKRHMEEPVTKELYLSDGLKHNLYMFTKRGDGFPLVFGSFVQESRLPGPEAPKTNNVKDIFGNIHIEKVSEKNYFKAQPLLKDANGNLLILYKTDLTETSPVILESVSGEGKTNWTTEDTLLLAIGKAFASENLGCDYAFSQRTLIISIPSADPLYMAIDINTGKILWTFSPATYIREQSS